MGVYYIGQGFCHTVSAARGKFSSNSFEQPNRLSCAVCMVSPQTPTVTINKVAKART